MEASDEQFQRDMSLSKGCYDTINLIEDGYKIIGEDKSENAILIMGNTGVGKSCLAAYLAGLPLKPGISNGIKCYHLLNPCGTTGLRISDEMDSETKIPVKLYLKDGEVIKVIIYDLPGFNDTEHQQEIANSFYIQRIFETRGGVKILLVIPECDFRQKATNFVRTIEHFARMFKKPEVLAKSITLVISKIDLNRTLANIQTDIKKILDANKSMTPQARTIIGYLSKSIALFPEPPLPPEYSLEHTSINPILQTVETDSSLNKMEKREYYEPEFGSMNVVVSEECKKGLVIELFGQRSKDLIVSLTSTAYHVEQICGQIAKETNKVVKVNSYFNKFLSLIKGEVEQKVEYKNMLSLNSLVSFRNFFTTMLDQNLSTQDFIDKFEKQINPLFDVLKQFFDQNGSNELEILRFIVKERMKHIEFLDKLCDQKI